MLKKYKGIYIVTDEYNASLNKKDLLEITEAGLSFLYGNIVIDIDYKNILEVGQI